MKFPKNPFIQRDDHLADDEDFDSSVEYEDEPYEADDYDEDVRSRFADDYDPYADDERYTDDRYEGGRYSDSDWEDAQPDRTYSSRYEDRYGREDDRYESRYESRYDSPRRTSYDDDYGDDRRYADDRYDRYAPEYDDRYAYDENDSYRGSSRFGSLDDEEYEAPDAYEPEESDAEAFDDVEPKGFLRMPRHGIQVPSDDTVADIVMFLAMILLPPLGLYMLYRRNRFDKKINWALMGVTAVWFVVAVVLLLNKLTAGNDPVAPQPLATPEIEIVETEATPEPVTDGGEEEEETVIVETPTEAPVQPVSTEPTPVPENVLVSSSGLFYHKTGECALVGSSEVLAQITIDNAKNRGKFACPDCYGLTRYYATDNGVYYHLDPKCNGMVRAKTLSQEAAEATGKPPCPTCIGATTQFEENGEPAVQPDATQEPMPSVKFLNSKTQDKSAITVYMTDTGTWFHTVSDCQGMKGAKNVSLLHALLSGKTACPQCCPEYGKTVYCTEGGSSFHKTATCRGMENAKKVSLAEAYVLGKPECSTCQPISGKTEEQIAQEKAESVYYVYASPNENAYYHINSTCSGMTDAQKVTLASMLREGVEPCPNCCAGASMTVYLEDAAKKYHSIENCSGTSGLTQATLANALANGYIRCPKCWDDGSQNNG